MHDFGLMHSFHLWNGSLLAFINLFFIFLWTLEQLQQETQHGCCLNVAGALFMQHDQSHYDFNLTSVSNLAADVAPMWLDVIMHYGAGVKM